MKPAGGDTGFTLVELLVALTLLGLISVMIFGGLRFGVRAWEYGDAHMEQVNRLQAVQDFLRRQLHQAARLNPQGEPQAEGIAGEIPATFVGAEQSLQFASLLPAYLGVGGYYLFTLGTREAEESTDLVLDWQLYRPDGSASEDSGSGGSSRLISGIEGITLGYFGAIRNQGEPDWQTEWDGARGLPGLVRLRVTFAPDDGRFWPELLVAPKT